MNSICNIFILILQIILNKYLISKLYDNFEYNTLEILEQEEKYFINVTDYLNISLIFTSSKNIYMGIPPILKSTTTANINKYSSVVTCNNYFILVSCLTDSLLTKININTGNSIPLLDYFDFENPLPLPDYFCSTSLIENSIYISLSRFSGNQINHKIIKINIINKDNIVNGPTIENKENDVKIMDFPGSYKKINFDRQILCEIISEKTYNNYKLFCIYEHYENSNYILYGSIINDNFDDIDYTKIITSSPIEISFRLYRVNDYYLKLLTYSIIYDIYLQNDNNQMEIIIEKNEFGQNDYSLYNNDFYYYNNNYLIKSSLKTFDLGNSNSIKYNFVIYQNHKTDYYEIYDILENYEDFSSIAIYYNENEDKILLVYQYGNKIKYIILNNNKKIYNIKQYQKVLTIKSNEIITFNVSELIETNNDFGQLNIYKKTEILSSFDSLTSCVKEAPYFNKITQVLTQQGSNNDWIEYTFCFREEKAHFQIEFILSQTKIKIQTCSFQCSSCTTNYTICHDCRENANFAKIKDSTDINCYPNNQLIEGYIYNSNTKIFEPCFHTCKFCTKNAELSSIVEQNCLFCAEGFFESYEYQGNCYKIKDGEKEMDKIVKNLDDEYFMVEVCPEDKPFKIYYTGECIDACPSTSNFYNYQYSYINFTEQENIIYQQQYVQTGEKAFIFKLGNICYDDCPINTNKDEINNKCSCQYAWHIENEYITCYNQNSCLYQEYKYYIDDQKQCLKNGCPEGYFQFNFECYKTACPYNTNPSSSNSYKCESIFNYCYINEYFHTICSEVINNEYIYRYDNTNQYLKSCNESLIYTIEESLTYLYNNICYLECPNDLLIGDDKNGICICKYKGYYDDNNQFICFENADDCNDKFIVIDNNECVNSLNDCINKDYKIFNNLCYKNGCPENTKLDIDNHSCKCSYFYYKNMEDNNLECLSKEENCFSQNYSYLNPDSFECFKTLDDCFKKGNFFYFNNNCYKSKCPVGKILFSSIVNQTLKKEISPILDINKNLENKIWNVIIF